MRLHKVNLLRYILHIGARLIVNYLNDKSNVLEIVKQFYDKNPVMPKR